MYCQNCGKQIPENSDFCTECGATQKANSSQYSQSTQTIEKIKKPVYKKWWFWVAAVFVVIIIAVATSGDSDSDEALESPNFTANETSTPSPTPAPTPTPTLSPEEQAALTAQEKAEFIASCQNLTYEQVARDPDTYQYAVAHFKGKVSQVIEGSGYNVYMINVTPDAYGYYEDAVYVQYTAPVGASRILEDDVVDMYGIMAGLQTYTTVLGAEKTIPAMLASYIDLAQ